MIYCDRAVLQQHRSIRECEHRVQVRVQTSVWSNSVELCQITDTTGFGPSANYAQFPLFIIDLRYFSGSSKSVEGNFMGVQLPPGTISNTNILCGFRTLPRSLVRCVRGASGWKVR
jgi:hypothetical protein